MSKTFYQKNYMSKDFILQKNLGTNYDSNLKFKYLMVVQ